MKSHDKEPSMSDRDVTRPRLMHLKDADDLQVAKGEPDIRGWDLRTMDGQRIGTVEDLVIDTEVMRVRYIEGKLELSEGGTETERTVLIPIADARLAEEDDDVLVDYSSIAARQMPVHDRQSLSTLTDTDDEHALDQDTRFFGARRSGRERTSYIGPAGDQIDRRSELL
jgi:sporulation protein YlmC with PRC-barrel domain